MIKKIYYPYPGKKDDIVRCPFCLLTDIWRHGTYTRKKFHNRHEKSVQSCVVQRYRCLNPRCKHCTFSLLPVRVMPYCHFFWSDLLLIYALTLKKISAYKIAGSWFGVNTSVIIRAQKLLASFFSWAKGQYKELTNGRRASDFCQCINTLLNKHGRHILRYMWFRYKYPDRLCQLKPHIYKL